MEIAKQLAGYTLGGADLLRRAMGKKIKAEMDAQREAFIAGAVARRHRPASSPTRSSSGRQVRRLRLQQEPRRGLRAARLSDRLAEGEPPGRVLCRGDDHRDAATTRSSPPSARRCASRGIRSAPPDVNRSGRASWSRTAERRRRPLRAGGDQGGGRRRRWSQLVEERQPGGPFATSSTCGAGWAPGAQQAPAGEPGPRRRLRRARRRTGAGFRGRRDVLLRHGAAAAEAAASDQVSLFGGAARRRRRGRPAGGRGLADAGAAAARVRGDRLLSLGPSAGRLPDALQRLGVTTRRSPAAGSRPAGGRSGWPAWSPASRSGSAERHTASPSSCSPTPPASTR